MKKAILTMSVMLAAGCSAQQEQRPALGMANPASVYCVKQGGKLDIVKTDKGEVGYCTLPSGERIEEWTLYRRDNAKIVD
ncbi:hypothetical protein AI2912V1_1979 [Klebsiella pneumoniae]|nr:hypothetical protein AH0329V1_1425 [Klebsiella pneumoniae]CAF2775123.1 hypothetical protein AI2929V1_1425 [Klebsiella pneumoniae]CAF3278570.1 hypothetical protein AI3028V1_1424 [Klebsiella pneumoniae]CAF9402654.1 hypothetical protein AI2917V1_1425 [Klebsiella pneumoniae]CAF9403237.1 hypothetical protein AI2906V1_1425 [Klebsiella pneumoniae]